MSGIVLQIYKIVPGVASARKQEDVDTSPILLHDEAAQPGKAEPIEIALHDYSLQVRLRHMASKPTTKVILQDINAKFASGLNVIIGPSGSGKTSMLQSIACRLHKTQLQAINRKAAFW